jgi:hypothetical protein
MGANNVILSTSILLPPAVRSRRLAGHLAGASDRVAPAVLEEVLSILDACLY